MMGPRREAQAALFCEFYLEDHVPQDHLLRSIDRFVDLSGIRQHLAPFYSSTGRPGVDKEGIMRYRARKSDCDTCRLKARCTPKEPQRKALRSIYEPSRDVARNIIKTAQYAVSCKLRKKVEMLFAHLKRILGLGMLQKFASVHSSVHNHFNLERHLTDRQTFKLTRTAALEEWRHFAT
jgi:transposase